MPYEIGLGAEPTFNIGGGRYRCPEGTSYDGSLCSSGSQFTVPLPPVYVGPVSAPRPASAPPAAIAPSGGGSLPLPLIVAGVGVAAFIGLVVLKRLRRRRRGRK